jgi:uncharacterized protein YjbJ (UPF0337 family)
MATYEGETQNPGQGQTGKAMQNVGSTIRKTAENVSGATQETVTNIREGLGEAKDYVRAKADDVTTRVGSALESTGHYLREDGLRNIGTDLTDLVRRNPVPAILCGIGAGYLLGVATHRGAGSAAQFGRGEFHA